MSDAPLATDTQSITVGDSLRNARTVVGWTVSEVATKLNLTAHTVESIEANQFERLPGTTFARGYIRNYAKILGLETNHLVLEFDRQIAGSADALTVQSIDRVSESHRVSRGMVQFSLFVGLLIILGAGYYAWQVFNTDEADTEKKAAVFDRVEVERADGSVHVQTLDEPEDQAVAFALESNNASATDADKLVALTVDNDQPQVLLLSTENEQASAQAETNDKVDNKPSEKEQTIEKLAPGMGTAQLSFVDDCWVRIVDADDKEISSGLKRAGENLTITGKVPLDIRLGYAKGVSITYNGEPVDFDSAIRGATARFKLGK